MLGFRTPWLDLDVWGGLLEVVLRKWRILSRPFPPRVLAPMETALRKLLTYLWGISALPWRSCLTEVQRVLPG